MKKRSSVLQYLKITKDTWRSEKVVLPPAKKAAKEAENLTVIRKEAAQRFTEQVKQALMDLNFLDVQFELDFRLLEDYMLSGQDEVCFMISTNPGQPLRPVQDTASGGELSGSCWRLNP